MSSVNDNQQLIISHAILCLYSVEARYFLSSWFFSAEPGGWALSWRSCWILVCVTMRLDWDKLRRLGRGCFDSSGLGWCLKKSGSNFETEITAFDLECPRSRIQMDSVRQRFHGCSATSREHFVLQPAEVWGVPFAKEDQGLGNSDCQAP